MAAHGPLLVAEESPDVLSRHTPDGTLLWVSPAVERVLGRSPSELVGRRSDELVHRDDRDGLRTLAERLAGAAGDVRQTYRLRHRDGRWLWVETALRAIREPAGGRIVELVGATRDVSERVAAIEALERSNVDLGRFATVASHDLAEPLLLMRGHAELLRAEAGERLTDADRARLDVIARNAAKLQALVDALLSYASVDHTRVGTDPVDVAALLDDTLALLQGRVAATGAVVRRGPLAAVPGDARLLGILLQNLLSNAMKFRSPERPLQIAVSCEPVDGGWELTVADNGIGMTAADAQRVFGVFERVDRSRYPGLGLGLATALRIAELHGGSIAVRSQPGAGATFRVTLTTQR